MPRGTPNNKRKLTKRFIDGLDTDNPRGERYYDPEVGGFGVTVYPNGKKTFFVRYGPKNRRRLLTIGAYGPVTPDDARNRAKVALGEVVKGEDPLLARRARRAIPTFREWSEAYLQHVRRAKKQPRHDERFLRITAVRWGNKAIGEITRGEVEAFRQAMAEGGKRTSSNRWLACIRACFQKALRDGVIPVNPAMGIRPFPENPPRARVLDDDEFERLQDAIAKVGDPHTHAAFRMLVETGARTSEVLKAKWEDLDLEEGTWRIPSPKAGKPQLVPLPQSLVSILRTLPNLGTYVIAGREPNTPRWDLQKAWRAVKALAGLKPDICIHDLRRTFCYRVAKSSGIHVASKLLRHADIRVTESVYTPLGFDVLRRAIEKDSRKIGSRGRRIG